MDDTQHRVAWPTTLRELERIPKFVELREQSRELVRLAAPLYKEQLRSIPFYQARRDDEHFWGAYVGSRVTAARYLVARSLGQPFQGVQP